MPDIVEEQIMWFPVNTYRGRDTAEYKQPVRDLDIDVIYELVKKRVAEDGEWLIANEKVGEGNQNEEKMRRMMAFASAEKNILQAVDYSLLEHGGKDSVDDICRELAVASRWAAGIKKS